MKTKKLKLTKPQAELLLAMQSGVQLFYMRYMGRFNPNAYYYRGDTHKRCTRAAQSLIEKDFVIADPNSRNRYDPDWILSEAGKEFKVTTP